MVSIFSYVQYLEKCETDKKWVINMDPQLNLGPSKAEKIKQSDSKSVAQETTEKMRRSHLCGDSDYFTIQNHPHLHGKAG